MINRRQLRANKVFSRNAVIAALLWCVTLPSTCEDRIDKFGPSPLFELSTSLYPNNRLSPSDHKALCLVLVASQSRDLAQGNSLLDFRVHARSALLFTFKPRIRCSLATIIPPSQYTVGLSIFLLSRLPYRVRDSLAENLISLARLIALATSLFTSISTGQIQIRHGT
jgi:hypothetical protein